MKFDEAKVVTSKFLDIMDDLDEDFFYNKNCSQSSHCIVENEQSLNIYALKRAINKLCKVLHEITIEEII